MMLSNLNSGAVAEKELLSEILAGADRKITIAQVEAALADQGLPVDRRIAVKHDLERKGMLVPPGQEHVHFAELRAAAAKGQAKVPVLTNIQAGGQVTSIGPTRHIAPAAPSGAWFGAIPKQSDVAQAQHVRAINAGTSAYLKPELAHLLRRAGISEFHGSNGTLDEGQRARVFKMAENGIQRKMFEVELFEAGI